MMTISVLTVWRFFLPEYQHRCLRLGLWIGCSVQSMYASGRDHG